MTTIAAVFGSGSIMLVANPGQTASYGLLSKKPCHSSTSSAASTSSNTTVTSGSTKNAVHNLSNKASRIALTHNCIGSTSDTTTKALQPKLAPPTANNTNIHHNIAINNYSNTSTNNTTSSSTINSNTATSTSNALMKTLSVRLNRGTEFLKETVQKAIISKLPSHLSSVLNLNLYTVPPTATHRFPTERINASSADSLHTEMCHFMPIRTAPTTPLKRYSKSRGASLKMPKACLAKKVHNYRDGAVDQTTWEVDGHIQFRPKPNSTLLTTIFTTPERQSAFVCLVANMKAMGNWQCNPHGTTEQHESKTNSTSTNNRGRTKSKSDIQARKSAVSIATSTSTAAAAATTTSTTTNAGKTNSEVLRKRRNTGGGHAKTSNIPKEPMITRSSIRNIRSSRTSSATSARAPANVVKSQTKMPLAKARGIVQWNNNINKNKKNNNNNINKKNNNKTNDEPGKQPRKLKRQFPDANAVDATVAADSERPTPRKNARLSKNRNAEAMNRTKTSVATRSLKQRGIRKPTVKNQKRAWTVFSPPLTRSRLKEMSELKLDPAMMVFKSL